MEDIESYVDVSYPKKNVWMGPKCNVLSNGIRPKFHEFYCFRRLIITLSYCYFNYLFKNHTTYSLFASNANCESANNSNK